MYSRLAKEWIAEDRMASETQSRFLLMAPNFYRRLVDNPREYNLSKEKTAELYDRIAAIEGETRNPEKALEANKKAVALQRELFKNNPSDIKRPLMMIDALLELGVRHATQNRPGEALELYRESDQIAAATRPRLRMKILTLQYQRALLKQNTAGALLALDQ